ncbi:MAG: hypothetical protein FJ279_22250, partial [Planctomycetes bacterium]|nr:hypothetical protein [Planctomycetota bacterium]
MEFARGLQSRGYYDLAEDQYGRIRDDAAAKADDKVDALAGLAELYAETAAKSPEPPKRDELLGKACESLKRLIADYAQHPKAVPTHYRRGELLLEHGNLVGGMLTDADSADAKAKLKARGEPLFQEALKEFQQAAAEYGKDIAKREKAATTTKDKEALHAFRAPLLQALVQIGWTHYFRSKLYAEDKAAANAALDAGLKAFAEFTAEHRGYLVTLVAYRGQGLCAHYLGKYDDAIKAFDTILRTRPTSETATLRQLAYHHKAASCVASGKHDDAIRAVTSLYKEFPDLSGDIADAAIIEKGRALVAQAAQLAAQSAQFTKANKAKEAEQAGKDSATKYSLAIDSLKPISTRGGAWGRTATELIAKWTRDAGRKVEASAGELMAQAQALFGERKFLPAIQTCRQTIEAADPRKDYEVEAQAWFAMGHAFFEMKRPYESALAFTALADERPASPLASEAAYFAIQLFGSLYNESKDARDSGRYVESLRLLGRRFPQHPEASKVQFLAAEMSRAQGQYQEAASDYARVVAAAEEYEQASYLAGLCYWLEFVRQSERGEAGAKAAADVGPK